MSERPASLAMSYMVFHCRAATGAGALRMVGTTTNDSAAFWPGFGLVSIVLSSWERWVVVYLPKRYVLAVMPMACAISSLAGGFSLKR